MLSQGQHVSMSAAAGAAACALAPVYRTPLAPPASPRSAGALPGLPPKSRRAGAPWTGRQSSPLSLLSHRVHQAPSRTLGTVPTVISGTGRSLAAAQSPCPCAGVPSHRTGVLHLFGKPAFINTARSYLHSPTPQAASPLTNKELHCAPSAESQSLGTALPGAEQQQPTGPTALGGGGSHQHMEVGAHCGHPSPTCQVPERRGAAAGLSGEAHEPLVTSLCGPSTGCWHQEAWEEAGRRDWVGPGATGHASPGENKAPTAAQLGDVAGPGATSGHPALVAASWQVSTSFLGSQAEG